MFLSSWDRNCSNRRQQDNGKVMHTAKVAEERLPDKQHVNMECR